MCRAMRLTRISLLDEIFQNAFWLLGFCRERHASPINTNFNISFINKFIKIPNAHSCCLRIKIIPSISDLAQLLNLYTLILELIFLKYFLHNIFHYYYQIFSRIVFKIEKVNDWLHRTRFQLCHRIITSVFKITRIFIFFSQLMSKFARLNNAPLVFDSSIVS